VYNLSNSVEWNPILATVIQLTEENCNSTLYINETIIPGT